METIGAEGRTLKDAILNACAELKIPEHQLRYKLDVNHFRDEFGKARGVDTVRILAWGDTSAPEPEERPAPVERDAEAAPVERFERTEAEPRRSSERRDGGRRGEERRGDRRPRDRGERSEDRPRHADAEGGESRSEGGELPVVANARELVDTFMRGAMSRLGLGQEFTIDESGDRLDVLLRLGEDIGMGDDDLRRVLRSLEYLCNRLSVGEGGRLPRISLRVDARGEAPQEGGDGDDQERQEKERALNAVAAKVAEQVRRQNKPLTLKPMNSYERRIIHLAIAQHEGVGSRSVGEGQKKKVQVFPEGWEDTGE